MVSTHFTRRSRQTEHGAPHHHGHRSKTQLLLDPVPTSKSSKAPTASKGPTGGWAPASERRPRQCRSRRRAGNAQASKRASCSAAFGEKTARKRARFQGARVVDGPGVSRGRGQGRGRVPWLAGSVTKTPTGSGKRLHARGDTTMLPTPYAAPTKRATLSLPRGFRTNPQTNIRVLESPGPSPSKHRERATRRVPSPRAPSAPTPAPPLPAPSAAPPPPPHPGPAP